MIAALGLLVGLAAGLLLHPAVPLWLEARPRQDVVVD